MPDAATAVGPRPRAVAATPARRRPLARLRGRPVLIASWAMIVLVVACALLAGVLAPDDPQTQSAQTLLAPGSAGHLLGTDNIGRDQLSRLLYGARPLLLVSVSSVVLAMLAGSAIGLVAGFRRGWSETLLMRSMDAILSFPLMLLGIVLIASLGPGARNLTLAVTVALVPLFARLVHGLALRESDADYVLAARAAGFPPGQIMLRQIAPNLAGPVLVQATSLFAMAAGYSTALSYLGLGIQAPTADWGLMVQEGQAYLTDAPDLAVIPGALITLLCVAVTFVGDDLRDLLDPAHRLAAHKEDAP